MSIRIVVVPNLEIKNKIIHIVNGILGAKSEHVLANWDSLNSVRVMLALEAEFKIRFTLIEIDAIKNLEDLHAAVGRKISST